MAEPLDRVVVWVVIVAFDLGPSPVAQHGSYRGAPRALEGHSVALVSIKPLGIAGLPLVAVIPALAIDLGDGPYSALNVKAVGIGLGLTGAHTDPPRLARLIGGGGLAAALARAATSHPRSGGVMRIWARLVLSLKIQASPDGAGVSVSGISPAPNRSVWQSAIWARLYHLSGMVGWSGPPMARPLAWGWAITYLWGAGVPLSDHPSTNRS
jgi:hypothetical protein